ncbi:MAG: hypothetical protein ACYC3I_13255, partial [Gemmataceae bacterium]
ADEVIEIIRHMSMCHGKVPPGEEKLLTKAQITCQTGFCQSFLVRADVTMRYVSPSFLTIFLRCNGVILGSFQMASPPKTICRHSMRLGLAHDYPTGIRMDLGWVFYTMP